MLTPQNSHTFSWCGSCPPASSTTFRRMLLWWSNSHSGELKGLHSRCYKGKGMKFCFKWRVRVCLSRAGVPRVCSSLWDKPLPTTLALVQPQFCSQLCLDPCDAGTSLLALLIGCPPHSVPWPSHVHRWTKHPFLASLPMLYLVTHCWWNLVLTSTSFKLHSDIHF